MQLTKLFRRKSLDRMVGETLEPQHQLKRCLGPVQLTLLGVGAIIGAGIFSTVGTAAAGGSEHTGAGPALVLSFVLVAIACGFAALCYSEFAAMVPVSGSAYTYAYATLGELIAWIIGWDLILEYAVSNMAVAVGFSAYLNDILENVFGWHIPAKFAGPPIAGGQLTGAWFNISALLVLMLLTYILVKGVRESARTNNVMVAVKIAAILIFVLGAARAVNTDNWRPFMPNGFSGVLTGAA